MIKGFVQEESITAFRILLQTIIVKVKNARKVKSEELNNHLEELHMALTIVNSNNLTYNQYEQVCPIIKDAIRDAEDTLMEI